MNGGKKEQYPDVDVKEILKFKPPEFYGSIDPSVTWNWIVEMEEMFDSFGCDEEHKVKVGVRMLRGWALEWWASIGMTNVSCLNWADFKNRMIKDFCLEEHKSKLESEFLSLKQGNMCVEEYAHEFVKKMRLVKHLVSDENYKIRRFMNGLGQPKSHVENNVGDATTLTEAIFRARKMIIIPPISPCYSSPRYSSVQ